MIPRGSDIFPVLPQPLTQAWCSRHPGTPGRRQAHLVCQKATLTTRGVGGLTSTFLKALPTTKDISIDVFSRRETGGRHSLCLPHPNVTPTPPGTPGTTVNWIPVLVIGGWVGAAVPGQLRPPTTIVASGQQAQRLPHLTDQETEAGEWGAGWGGREVMAQNQSASGVEPGHTQELSWAPVRGHPTHHMARSPQPPPQPPVSIQRRQRTRPTSERPAPAL